MKPHMNSFHIIGDNENLRCHVIIRRIWRSGLDHVDAKMLDQPILIIVSQKPPRFATIPGGQSSAVMMLCRIDHPGPDHP